MQLILFFTNPDSLSAIGILFPWDDEKHIYKLSVCPHSESANQQIWVVHDEISFAELKQELDEVARLEELYYVYHTLPLGEEFLKPFKAYLDQRRIFTKCRKAYHAPNVRSLYEELGTIPFTTADFKRIVEKIQPATEYIYRVLNKLSDARKVVEHQVNLIEYPGWVRKIYGVVMTAVDQENFEEKRLSLKKELEKYCQGMG